jgi:hypothetical protein
MAPALLQQSACAPLCSLDVHHLVRGTHGLLYHPEGIAIVIGRVGLEVGLTVGNAAAVRALSSFCSCCLSKLQLCLGQRIAFSAQRGRLASCAGPGCSPASPSEWCLQACRGLCPYLGAAADPSALTLLGQALLLNHAAQWSPGGDGQIFWSLSGALAQRIVFLESQVLGVPR